MLPTYTAIGGAHTCGYPPITQAQLLRTVAYKALRAHSAVRRLQNSCLVGAGPTYPACCLPYFVPPSTRFATLEFVSSLRANERLHLFHLARMIRLLQERSVTLVLLNLIPREPSLAGSRGYAATAEKLEAVAADAGVPVLTITYGGNASLWATESTLNQLGHRVVGEAAAKALLQARRAARTRGAARRAGEERWAQGANFECTARRVVAVLPKFARSLPLCSAHRQ
ncbi:hypothetical protein AB1Y20_003842 [Prymnesium parvum]|uniref:Uncharacterized protein n=1 Tax=Prymnesium parvum TaxID=97485 RepID=A0AB34J867_PRYPA